ncbi:MAG: hypothetical protein JXA54_08205, partial [Candidatus Heimdallarchaeota archaeon]|nr:hypothetical protein [Candidatus Heimdallarchaeota archaeon]
MMKIQLIKKIIITLITLQLIIAPVYVSAMGNSEKIIKPNNNNIDIDSLIEELLKAIANQKKNIPFNLIENIHINYINDESLLKVNGGNNGLPLGDRITINAILAPVLSSPEDGTFMNDNTPLLTWEYVYEAFDYNVQVSSNSQFTNLVVNTYTGLYTEYTCPTPSDNQYWWRVCGVEFGGTNGPWSNVRSFTVDTTPPAAPTLVSPEDNFPTNDNTPSFSWNTVVTAVNYQIQIDDNSDFGSPVISITTGTSTSFTVSSSLPDRPYYWHVRAQDSVGNWGSYSAYRRIYIDTDPVGTPVLVTPEDGSLYNYNTIDMDWTTVLSGYEYNIQLSRDIAFTDIVYNTFLQSTEITYSSLADDTYYWHVRARDIAGNWGTFSSTNFFVIDTTPPGTPTLSSPDDEVITSDNTPYFSWSPVDTANLYQIQIDDNADCSSPFITYSSGSTSYTPASLADNVYYWRVRARDAAGNYGNWSEIRSIIVDTTAPTINDVVVVPDTLDDDDVIAVYCNVTDLNGISQVNLYYRINSGEWGNIPMTWIFDNHYEATLGTFAYDDLIEFYITADDIADTANQAIDDNGGLYYSFTIESSDYTAPVINSISINPTSPEDDDYVYFNCHATDANGIQSVTVYYRVNGGEWGAILMDYITGSEYEVSHTPFGYGDFIEYYFVAIDNSPNHNTATNDNGGSYYYFTVESSDHYNPVIENIQHNPSIPTD